MNKNNYNEFIKGLELKNIRLKNIESKLRSPHPPEGQLKVEQKMFSEFEIEETLLRAVVSIILSFKDTKTRRIMAKIKLSLYLEYIFNTVPTDETLQIFKETSLLVNAWPYLRFWIQTLTQSFGWPPLVMPLLKVVPDKTQKAEEKKS